VILVFSLWRVRSVCGPAENALAKTGLSNKLPTFSYSELSRIILSHGKYKKVYNINQTKRRLFESTSQKKIASTVFGAEKRAIRRAHSHRERRKTPAAPHHLSVAWGR
jgi:hypothetical protein